MGSTSWHRGSSVLPWTAQTSLAQFNALYIKSIDEAERSALPSKRIANIIDTLTYKIYLYITRGLYEKHKLVFALMLANKILLAAGKVRRPPLLYLSPSISLHL